MQSDHPVLHRHPVDKRLLVVDEVGVGDPELIGDSVVECQVERDAGVGQALVSPGLLEVHGDGVVLRNRESAQKKFLVFTKFQVLITAHIQEQVLIRV